MLACPAWALLMKMSIGLLRATAENNDKELEGGLSP